MEINKEAMDKLKSLNNEQLRLAIGEIADALGASPAQKRMAQNNAGMLRRKFSAMSESDLKKQFAKIDAEKQQELMRKLKL